MPHFGDQMYVPLMGLFAAPQIDFPGGEVAVLMVLRWIHLISGITWVGLLYFFTLVNMPFLQELDSKLRGIVVPKLMPRALWWFRWSALVTVLAGIAYWMHIVGQRRPVCQRGRRTGVPGNDVRQLFCALDAGVCH